MQPVAPQYLIRSSRPSSTRISERRLTVPGGELAVEVRGDRGPGVLCLHGLSAHRASWRLVAPLLEDRCRLVLPDLLGRGESPAAPAARFGLRRETERLRRLLPLLEGSPWIALGHSHGAALALSLAREPGCRGVVLLSPVTPWTRRPPILELLDSPLVRSAVAPVVAGLRVPIAGWVLRRRVFADPADVGPDVVRRYADPWATGARARTLLRLLADWRPAELQGRLPDARTPARVLLGTRDRRIRRVDARRLAGRLGAELVLVEDAAHALPEERPDLVASTVRSLVTDLMDAEPGGT